MSDLVGVPWQSSTITVVLTGVLLALLVVRFVTPAIDELGAAGTIGLVLIEAIVLYAGYGAMTRTASPIVQRLLVSE